MVSLCIRLESRLPRQAWGGVGRAGLGDPQPLPWQPAGLSCQPLVDCSPSLSQGQCSPVFSPWLSSIFSFSLLCHHPVPCPLLYTILQRTPLLLEWGHIPTVPLGAPGLKQRSCQPPGPPPPPPPPPSKLSLLRPPWSLMGHLLPSDRSPRCDCAGPSLVTASCRCVSSSSWWQVLEAGSWLSQLCTSICTRLSVLTHLGSFSCQAGPLDHCTAAKQDAGGLFDSLPCAFLWVTSPLWNLPE